MDRQGLTAKQQRIYDFLRQTIRERGFPPSVREICAEVGLSSPSTVHAHLSALEEKGYIRRDPSKPRAIEITDQSFLPDGRETFMRKTKGRNLFREDWPAVFYGMIRMEAAYEDNQG